MSEVRRIEGSELPEVAAFVAALQADPTQHVGYYGSEAGPIEEQMRALEPLGMDAIRVAVADGRVVGFLQGEWDTDPPRVWWHGPFVRALSPDGMSGDWDAIADELWRAAEQMLPPEVVEAELCPDVRNVAVARFAERHGFSREVASAVLWRELTNAIPAPAAAVATIRPAAAPDLAFVASLHDELFPDTHTPGDRLVEPGERILLVAEQDDRLVGYLAAEQQPDDGEGYLDFVGVVPHARRGGVAGELIRDVCDRLTQLGASRVDLTVREDLHGARTLYTSLGFTEERVLVPWRRGFATR